MVSVYVYPVFVRMKRCATEASLRVSCSMQEYRCVVCGAITHNMEKWPVINNYYIEDRRI